MKEQLISDPESKSSSKNGGIQLRVSTESPHANSTFVDAHSEGRGLSSNDQREKLDTFGGNSEKSSAYFKASL